MRNGSRYLPLIGAILLSGCGQFGQGADVLATRATTSPTALWHAHSYVVVSDTGPAEGQTDVYVRGAPEDRTTLSFLVQGRARLFLSVSCDGAARFVPGDDMFANPAWTPAGTRLQADLAPQERNRTWLELGHQTHVCSVHVTGGQGPYSLTLQREAEARPRVAAIDRVPPRCHTARSGSALTRAYMRTDALSATCPMPMGRTTFLADGVDALNARVEALTGRRLSRAALEAGDPDVPLDWSNAPQLDLIYVNYLNFNADFSGYLTARMLAFHAARGTIIRILASDVMLTATDRRLFEGLAARFPTVQLQPYRFPANAVQTGEDQLARIHRVSHVKLFATVAREPGRSVAIIGGRNIHDGYYFLEPRDVSDWPFLLQYDPDGNRISGGFTTYDDFEVALHSDAAVRQIVGHMASLWHRDFATQQPAPSREPMRQAQASTGDFLHFLSVPFADDEAQLEYFVGLFDAARHRIHIASPYLNLPPALEAAMLRALDRGVEIEIVLTVRVREAADLMVTALNRDFINRFGDRVSVVDYDPFPRLMHSKLMVIDDRISVVSSTNLNQRSFVHDLENGIVVDDPAFARQIDAVIQSYRAQGTLAQPGYEISGVSRFLTGIRTILRAF